MPETNAQNRRLGYTRASTGAQDLTGQLAQLEAAGCEKVFRDKLTGAAADRPQLHKLISALSTATWLLSRQLIASHAR